jgi:UDP-N-acetylmuramoyl-tripeptide--D-alanyl-D-alanine ligase
LGRQRARGHARIVAVTGSVGKTGTKEALRHVLARQGETHASVASYNNHWGVPLTLARMPETAEFGVFEIGMNHSFEILPLVSMVRPHVTVITTVEPVHLAHFPGIEAIADAKGEIFSGLTPGGTAIINRDNPHFARLAAHAAASPAGRIVTFGARETADVRLVSARIGPDSSDVSATLFGRPLDYRIGSPGRHTVMNSLAVLGAVSALGGDPEEAARALADLSPPEGRGARIELPLGSGAITLIDESYNANPASMRAALAVLSVVPVGSGGRRVAVMGDMLELGDEAARHHAAMAEAVEAGGIDLVFACGPEMKHLWDDLPAAKRGAYASTSAQLGETLLAALKPGDAVMIKGSFGSRMGPLVKLLKQRLAGDAAQQAGQ